MLARKLNKLQQKAGLIIGLLLLLASVNVQGALSRPVNNNGKPTEVHVLGAVLDIDKIDTAEQNFTLNFYTIFRWIDPKQVPNQLSVAVTTVLTLIAYHIALSGRLPDIPYLTHMDKFLFSSTVLVFMALIEVVITSHLSSIDQLVKARKIDRTARWLFPLLFFSALAFSFFI